jgi:Ku protein
LGYALDKDNFIEVSKEELENFALESIRTIEIDELVDRSEIDPRYLIRPYYLRPDGKVGHDAFAVIRETIREMDKVAIGRVVLTNREHIIALRGERAGARRELYDWLRISLKYLRDRKTAQRHAEFELCRRRASSRSTKLLRGSGPTT